MEIYINLTELEELGLNPSLYAYLYTLHYNLPYTLADETTKEYMNVYLENKGFIKVSTEGIILRHESDKLFKKGTPTPEGVAEWIDEWRELFPKGVKSGNRPVRGDRGGVIKKMNTFTRNHPKITKEQIYEATKQYVFECSRKNYQFMICADYFITKNNSSMLAAMVEDIAERGSTLAEIEQGGGSWHREI